VVYRARAQQCYRLAEFGREIGHRLNFCTTECSDCAFYRAVRGLATTILVVTRDDGMAEALVAQTDSDALSLHLARSGYECASIIGSIRPAVIVLDSDLPEVLEDLWRVHPRRARSRDRSPPCAEA
jgi:PleD family two-component response regulator